MNEDISRTGSDKRWWDYRQLWNSREARWRSMLVISIAFITQVSLNLSTGIRDGLTEYLVGWQRMRIILLSADARWLRHY
jgi:hypothetical protein